MKRIAKISVIMLLILIMSPLAAFAAPQGYMEVDLTKKNFKNYFEVVKMKDYDSFGDYNGYSFIFRSKLLKKGYYLYKTDDFAVRYSGKVRGKYKYKKKTEKYTYKIKYTSSYVDNRITSCSNSDGYKYNYNYAKINNFKVLKAKGKLVFIEPSNIISIEHRYSTYDGSDQGLVIKLRYPYDSNTDYVSHWDEASKKQVIDYYYKTISWYNKYSNGTKDGVIVR